MSDAPAISVEGVSKRFGDTTAVDNVDLLIAEGEFFSMLGPSGCGKTTTLRMIAGFEDPTSGRIVLRGEDVTSVGPAQRNLNMVFQEYGLFPHMTVADNVEFGLKVKGTARGERGPRVAEAIESMQLTGFEKRRPAQLSGGQRQRVALARALVNRPAALLLDEPLGALDFKLRKEMQLELKRIQQRTGTTFVYVTHDQEEALTMSDRIAVMSEGKVEQLADPRTLYERPASAFVAGFIGVSNLLELEAPRPRDGLVGVEFGEGQRLLAPDPGAADGAAAGDDPPRADQTRRRRRRPRLLVAPPRRGRRDRLPRLDDPADRRPLLRRAARRPPAERRRGRPQRPRRRRGDAGLAGRGDLRARLRRRGRRAARHGVRRIAELFDIHSHVIPGVDDGSPDLATTEAMLAAMAAAGTTSLWATPHVADRAGFPGSPERLALIGERFEELLTVVPAGLTVRRGHEVTATPERLAPGADVAGLALAELEVVLIDGPAGRARTPRRALPPLRGTRPRRGAAPGPRPPRAPRRATPSRTPASPNGWPRRAR